MDGEGAPTPPVAGRGYERVLVVVFEWTAGVYALAAAVLMLLGAGGMVPRDVAETGVGVHVGLAVMAAALATLAAAMYAIPRAQDGRLWSLPLGWAHWMAVNAAVLYPAWQFHLGRESGPDGWLGTVLVAAALHGLGLGAMLLNLAESLYHSDDRRFFSRFGL